MNGKSTKRTEENKYYSSSSEIGPFILAALDKKGWSQVKLAEEIGVHKTHVNKWIKDRVRPSSSYIDLIAEVLEVTPYEILTGKTKDPANFQNKQRPKEIVESEIRSIESLLNQLINMDDKGDRRYVTNLILGKVRLLLDES